MSADVTHAYVGTKACGCTVAAVIDDPKYQKDTAKAVRDYISHGYTVARVLIDDARLCLGPCRCDKPADLFSQGPATQREGEGG